MRRKSYGRKRFKRSYKSRSRISRPPQIGYRM